MTLPRRATADPIPVLLRPPAEAIVAAPTLAAAPPFLSGDADPEAGIRAAECLTAAVYYEARSEPRDGQRAVAQVVLNRVRNPAFPASVCGVVYQRASSNGGCQFSFACDGSMLQRRDRAAWRRAQEVASAALAGKVYAPVGAATFYHTVSILPWWASSLARVATIGAHIFYRLGDGWRGALDFHQAYAAVEPQNGAAGDDAPSDTDIVRYATQIQAGVTVHRGATDFAGIVVHRGEAPELAVAAGNPASGVRVHVGHGGDDNAG